VAVDIAVLEDGEGVADTRYPEVREARPIQYRVIWKRPITGDLALPFHLRLHDSCRDLDTPARSQARASIRGDSFNHARSRRNASMRTYGRLLGVL
jgi:hypothetical protein